MLDLKCVSAVDEQQVAFNPHASSMFESVEKQ